MPVCHYATKGLLFTFDAIVDQATILLEGVQFRLEIMFGQTKLHCFIGSFYNNHSVKVSFLLYILVQMMMYF
jgi:hypothetical protein